MLLQEPFGFFTAHGDLQPPSQQHWSRAKQDKTLPWMLLPTGKARGAEQGAEVPAEPSCFLLLHSLPCESTRGRQKRSCSGLQPQFVVNWT